MPEPVRTLARAFASQQPESGNRDEEAPVTHARESSGQELSPVHRVSGRLASMRHHACGGFDLGNRFTSVIHASFAPAIAAHDGLGFVQSPAPAGLVSKQVTATWAKVDVGQETSAANQPAATREGDDHFVVFLRDHREPLIAFLRKSAASHEDAQDIAQETMMRMLRYRDQPADALKILMYRIAINALNDRGRRQKTRHAPEHVSLDEDYHALPSHEPAHDQRVATEQELALVRAAIMQLPTRSRQIYLLNRINGMSYTQIARHCGISVKAVEKNIGRALALLRVRMKESGYESLQEP
ncbi:sigma-70 family RNA polymerase sigma factor [Lysobacter sp. Root690]|uniref:RNA polymerase sigma factor n=1 Tax=Lysobacter sp. Root690 TaxID=1736588 RepID=UPI0031B641E5